MSVSRRERSGSKPKFGTLRKRKNAKKSPLCGFKRHSPILPPIIEQTCEYIEQSGACNYVFKYITFIHYYENIALVQEGLFRISGSQENIRQIKDKYERG